MDWKVLAPVMLHVDGKLLGPIVGTTFEPGAVINGIRVSEVLDNECWSAHLSGRGCDEDAGEGRLKERWPVNPRPLC